MTLKSDANFEEKLTLGCKHDMRNLVNFNVSSGKSRDLQFDVLLLPKSHKSFSLKITEELSLMKLKKDPNFEEKLTFYLKNDMRNLVNFNLSSGKSENLYFCRKYRSSHQRCSVKKVVLEISQNSHIENSCAIDSFLIKLQAST